MVDKTSQKNILPACHRQAHKIPVLSKEKDLRKLFVIPLTATRSLSRLDSTFLKSIAIMMKRTAALVNLEKESAQKIFSNSPYAKR
ncbi:MAG: hypothetical protein HY963_09675 [Ignavibacteriales bacterium]|nr:hypothetical protein [Ignavibacteriales bacterium]